jgi:molybdopterin synthase sulfur carrier subunit
MPLIKFFGNLRQLANISRIEAEGETVKNLLDTLCYDKEALRNAIFDGDQLRQHIRVVVNGHDIMLDRGLDTPLVEKDQVAIFPPMGGG